MERAPNKYICNEVDWPNDMVEECVDSIGPRHFSNQLKSIWKGERERWQKTKLLLKFRFTLDCWKGNEICYAYEWDKISDEKKN